MPAQFTLPPDTRAVGAGLSRQDIPAAGLQRKLGPPGSQGRTAPAAHSRPGRAPP